MTDDLNTQPTEDDAIMETIKRLSDIGESKGFISTWCVENVDDLNALSDFHPFTDAHTLTYTTLRYGNRPAVTVAAAIKGKRWMDLWDAAERIIRKGGVVDHRFVEDFNQAGKPGVLIVTLGS